MAPEEIVEYLKRKELKSVYSVTGSILCTAGLISDDVAPAIQALLLPAVAVTYGPPLLMNSINGKFEVSPQGFVTFLTGLLVGLAIYKNTKLLALIGWIPLLGKSVGTIEQVHSGESSTRIVTENVMGSFLGMIIRKAVTKQRVRLGTSELSELLLYNVGLVTIRQMKLPDVSAFALVYGLHMSKKIGGLLSTVRRDKGERDAGAGAAKKSAGQPLLNTSPTRMPRRRASVANALEKKK